MLAHEIRFMVNDTVVIDARCILIRQRTKLREARDQTIRSARLLRSDLGSNEGQIGLAWARLLTVPDGLLSWVKPGVRTSYLKLPAHSIAVDFLNLQT